MGLFLSTHFCCGAVGYSARSRESLATCSVSSEATGGRHARQFRQVEVADHAQSVRCCAVHQVFRQSVEPCLIVALHLQQFRYGITPALGSAATIGGSAVAQLRRALRMTGPIDLMSVFGPKQRVLSLEGPVAAVLKE
jgi:hypothetical protein